MSVWHCSSRSWGVLVLTKRWPTLRSGAPRLANPSGVCLYQEVRQGGKSVFLPAACDVKPAHVLKCGDAISLPYIAPITTWAAFVRGRRLRPHRRNQKRNFLIFKNPLSHQVKCREPRTVTPFPAGSHRPGCLLSAGTTLACPPAGSRGTSSPDAACPCVLAQVPLHQPGGPLGDPGLRHAVRPVPLLHLQGLRPVDGKAGVGVRPGKVPSFGGRWWGGIPPPQP